MRKQIVNTFKSCLRYFFADTIQKRLGYSKNSKLLIIHADDLGLSVSENDASFEAMRNGAVNLGSVMVNCPELSLSKYVKENPNADIGIHLTITSEWDSYKLKPVMPVSEVSSLIDSDGFLLPSNNHINNKAVLKDIEKEYRAQILKALESGIDLTHIDSHMFTPFSNKGILKIYKALEVSSNYRFYLPRNYRSAL